MEKLTESSLFTLLLNEVETAKQSNSLTAITNQLQRLGINISKQNRSQLIEQYYGLNSQNSVGEITSQMQPQVTEKMHAIFSYLAIPFNSILNAAKQNNINVSELEKSMQELTIDQINQGLPAPYPVMKDEGISVFIDKLLEITKEYFEKGNDDFAKTFLTQITDIIKKSSPKFQAENEVVEKIDNQLDLNDNYFALSDYRIDEYGHRLQDFLSRDKINEILGGCYWDPHTISSFTKIYFKLLKAKGIQSGSRQTKATAITNSNPTVVKESLFGSLLNEDAENDDNKYILNAVLDSIKAAFKQTDFSQFENDEEIKNDPESFKARAEKTIDWLKKNPSQIQTWFKSIFVGQNEAKEMNIDGNYLFIEFINFLKKNGADTEVHDAVFKNLDKLNNDIRDKLDFITLPLIKDAADKIEDDKKKKNFLEKSKAYIKKIVLNNVPKDDQEKHLTRLIKIIDSFYVQERLEKASQFLSRDKMCNTLLNWGWSPSNASQFAKKYIELMKSTSFAVREAAENQDDIEAKATNNAQSQNNVEAADKVIDAVYNALTSLDFIDDKIKTNAKTAYDEAKEDIKDNSFKLEDLDNEIEKMLKIGEPYQMPEDKNELMVIENLNNELANVTPPLPPEVQNGEAVDPDPQPSDPSKPYLIWPANPYFNVQKGDTASNIQAAENLLRAGTVEPKNVFVFVPKKGADGDFGYRCIEQYLHSKIGLGSKLAAGKDYKLMTSIATFVQQCSRANSEARQGKGRWGESLDTPRERMRAHLLEGDVKVETGKGEHGKDPTAYVTRNNREPGVDNTIDIYCTPRIAKYFGEASGLFDKVGLTCVTHTEGFKDDTTALSEGQQVFSDMLSYINGKKNFSASKTDTKMTKASIQKQQASYVDRNPRLFESDKKKWSWENIKANTGAKQFMQSVMNDAQDIKKGMDDGGNPSKLVQGVKGALTAWGDIDNAALHDGLDFFMGSVGLGWIGPALKRFAQEYQKAGEEYEGAEAFVRSGKGNSFFEAAEDPDFYFEQQGGTK